MAEIRYVCRARAQAALLWGQAALFYWYTSTLFWSGVTSGPAKAHLRVLMAAKSLGLALCALQLRAGYPPPASYQCARTSLGGGGSAPVPATIGS